MCKWLNTNYQYKNLGLFPLLLTFKMQAQSVTKVHLSIGLTAPSLGDTTEKMQKECKSQRLEGNAVKFDPLNMTQSRLRNSFLLWLCAQDETITISSFMGVELIRFHPSGRVYGQLIAPPWKGQPPK